MKDPSIRPSDASYGISFALCCLILILNLIGFTPAEQIGQRGSGTAYNEYLNIFFILALYYAQRNRRLICLILILAMVYAMRSFLFGGRVNALSVLVSVYLIIFDHKFRLTRFFPVIIIGYFSMIIIGACRGNGVYTVDAISNEIVNVFRGYFVWDTAYACYHTSMTFLFMRERLEIVERLNMLLSFCKGILFGENRIAKANLSYFTRLYYPHWYGGVLPIYVYFYLGYWLVGIISVIVGVYIKMISTAKDGASGLKKCLSVYMASTVFRWYMYSPMGLFRAVLLFCLAYGLCWLGYRMLDRKPLLTRNKRT